MMAQSRNFQKSTSLVSFVTVFVIPKLCKVTHVTDYKLERYK